jgi:hypothetical protein
MAKLNYFDALYSQYAKDPKAVPKCIAEKEGLVSASTIVAGILTALITVDTVAVVLSAGTAAAVKAIAITFNTIAVGAVVACAVLEGLEITKSKNYNDK